MAQPSLWELPTGLPEIPSGTSGGIRKTWKHLIWRSHHLMPWRTGPLQQNKTIIGCSNKEQKTTSHHPQVLYPNPSFVMYQASYIYIYIILYYIILCYIILYYIIYISARRNQGPQPWDIDSTRTWIWPPSHHPTKDTWFKTPDLHQSDIFDPDFGQSTTQT